MRKLALTLACAAILGTSTAQAMGLGEMAVLSYLNQPLRAEIPLTDVSASELEQIRARFASAQAFEEEGLSLSAVASRIQVQLQGGKHPRIVLTSNAPVRDPVLGVVLEVEGPDGVLRRVYDILLDPVTYRPPQPVFSAVSGQPATAAAKPTASIVETTPAGTAETSGAKLESSVEDGRYIVRQGETLWRIAYNLRPDGVSTEQMMAALRAANRQAFVDPSRDETLLSGARLRIPALAEIRSAKVVKAPVPAADKMEAKPVTPPDVVPAVETAEVPVEPRVAIIAPAQPVAPVVGEAVSPPVVGEVITPPATAGEAPVGTGTEMIQMQEQLEALKLENEQLQQRLGTSEHQMRQMEELLRLKDEQIAQLEQLVAQIGKVEQRLEDATGVNTSAEVEKPAEAQASRPPAPVPPQPQPDDAGGLMATLTNPVTLGAASLVALLVALLIGRQRRRREQGGAELQPVVVPESQPSAEAKAPTVATAPIAAAGGAAGAAMAAGLEEQEARNGASDPVLAVLEEVDVMLAYGLHDRALDVLDEAIANMPGADVLQARRVRLFHEIGAKDDFLRAAEDYRATHPMADDPHWAGIQAIGMASYADAPLFAGAGMHAHAPVPEATQAAVEKSTEVLPPSGEPDHASFDRQAAAEELPVDVALEHQHDLEPLVLQETGSATAVRPHGDETSLEPLTLELPELEPVSSQGEEATGVAESDSLVELDLGHLELESLGAPAEEKAEAELLHKLPKVESVQAPQPAALVTEAEVPMLEPVIEASTKAPGDAGTISEDDLMLLGLDASSIAAKSLDLSSLPILEEEVPAGGVEPSLPVVEAAHPANGGTNDQVPSLPVVEAVHSGAALLPPQTEDQARPDKAPAAATPAAFDERELKLDMAQALVDLGEHQAARSMLEELASGHADDLAVRAREMLERSMA